MADHIDIFIDPYSNLSLEDFVQTLKALLHVDFERATHGSEVWYEFRDAYVVVTVGEHDYEDDRNLTFRDYRFDIEVRALNIKTEAERKEWRDGRSYSLFERLKDTRQFSLLLVENLNTKLKEFQPD